MNGVVLYYEEGPGIGLGHRRRMEALTKALERLGVSTECRPVDEHDPSDPRVRVVDSYRVRADDERFAGAPVVAIDDLERDLAVDLVIHPAPLSDPDSQQSAKRVLAGLEYAIIDVPDVQWRPTTNEPKSVLVTLGGSDTAGLGAFIAELLAADLPDVQVRHAPGPWSKRTDSASVETVEAPDGLVDDLLAATVVVTAGGVTMLEALALGCPTVVVPTADNQMRAVEAIPADERTVVLTSETPTVDVSSAAMSWLRRGCFDHQITRSRRRVVDRSGTDRVAAQICRIDQPKSSDSGVRVPKPTVNTGDDPVDS